MRRRDVKKIIAYYFGIPEMREELAVEREELEEVRGQLEAFCGAFGYDISQVMNSPFTAVTPDSGNPYRQMYVMN